MTTQNSGIRLGDLLTGAGLLKADDLREAVAIAKNQALPVGRVLIMSGYLTERQLQAAVQAQSMLKDSIIELDAAFRALRIVSTQQEITMEQALSNNGWVSEPAKPTNKLGELLLEAGIINQDHLNYALDQCNASGLPLGRVFVVTGMLGEPLLAAALSAQVLIRDGKLTREQAVQGLKSSRERQVPLEQLLDESGSLTFARASIRLGELLNQAGLLDEANQMHAVELGLLKEQPVGQVLIELGLLTDEVLQTALSLQTKIAQGELGRDDAPSILSRVVNQKISLEEALAQLAPVPQAQNEPIPLYQFLQLAGVINALDVQRALKAGSRDNELMGKMLVLAGVCDESIINAANQANELVQQGSLRPEQAIMAANYCSHHRVPLSDAFAALSVQNPDGSIGTPQPGGAAAPAAATATPPAAPAGQMAGGSGSSEFAGQSLGGAADMGVAWQSDSVGPIPTIAQGGVPQADAGQAVAAQAGQQASGQPNVSQAAAAPQAQAQDDWSNAWGGAPEGTTEEAQAPQWNQAEAVAPDNAPADGVGVVLDLSGGEPEVDDPNKPKKKLMDWMPKPRT